MEGAGLMPCNGCNEKKVRAKTERQLLDAKLMAALSEAITKLFLTDRIFAERLMALNAELNAQSVKERNELGSPAGSLTLAESVKG